LGCRIICTFHPPRQFPLCGHILFILIPIQESESIWMDQKTFFGMEKVMAKGMMKAIKRILLDQYANVGT
jgi:hypothetical protein